MNSIGLLQRLRGVTHPLSLGSRARLRQSRRRMLCESLEDRRVLAATVPMLESFEVADLTALTNWTFATANQGTVTLDTVTAAHDGTNTLRFDVASSLSFGSQSEATVEVDLSAFSRATDLNLDFWMKRLNSSTSSDFFMEVDASGDGTTWSSLSPMLQPAGNTWVNYTYDLDTRLNDAGITLDSDVFLRFQHNGYTSSHEVVIDEVRIGQDDVVGPYVVSVTPSSTDVPVTSLNVVFSEPLGRFDFDAQDVSIVGPSGSTTLSRLTGVSPGIEQSEFTWDFDRAQTIPGTYHVTIPASIRDSAGNRMNQDQDALNGETIEDRYVGSFTLGPQVAQAVPYMQDFSDTTLSELQGWNFSSQNSGTISFSGALDGNRYLTFSQTERNQLSTTDAILLLDLSDQVGATDLAFDFDSRRVATSDVNHLAVSVSDDGNSWTQMGGLIEPSADFSNFVFDLDEELASAGITPDSTIFIRFRHTSNWSVRTLNLDNIRIANRDFAGPSITSVVPVGPVISPFEELLVTFDEPIDTSTFTVDDILLTSPGGVPIATRSPVDLGDNQNFSISYPGQETLGSYQLSIGADVRDLSGNGMNQDGDQTNSEPLEDVFQHRFDVGVPVSKPIPYFQDFSSDSLSDLAEWKFGVFGGQGVIELGRDEVPLSDPRHLEFAWHNSSTSRQAILKLDLSDQQDATDLALDFWVKRFSPDSTLNGFTVAVSGDESFYWQMGPTIYSEVGEYVNYHFDLDQRLSSAGIARDQDVYVRFLQNSTYGMAIDDVRVANRDAIGPSVTSLTGTTSTALSELSVTFDEPIDSSTFTSNTLNVIGPMGPVGVSTAPVDSGDQTTFTILLDQPQLLAGSYSLSINTDVKDAAGNPMNQNGNSANGESADVFSGSVQVDALISGASIPYFQGFDDAHSFSNHWLFESEPGGQIQLTEDDGRSVLQMDSELGADLPINSAIVSLDLDGKSGVRLLYEGRNEDDITSSNDGVYISDDLGVTWSYALSGVSRFVDGWQHQVLDLDARTAAVGMTYTDNFWIRFQQSGTAPWPAQGRRYDNLIVENSVSITAEVNATEASEGATNALLTVTRDAGSDLTQPLEIAFSSSDPSEATLPPTFSIPVNAESVDVPITIVDDVETDGPQWVTLTATAPNGSPRNQIIQVTDNEPAGLEISLNRAFVSEADGSNAAVGTIHRTADFDSQLVVTLSSQDPDQVSVPTSVTIPAGAPSANFTVSVPNDFEIDGNQLVTIDASAVGFVADSLSVDVRDDDTVDRRTIGGTHFGTLPKDNYVVLENLTVPPEMTLTIEPGSTLEFAPFTFLWINGTAIADGTMEEPITFTSPSTASYAGAWGGITYRADEQTRSTFNHVEITYATVGLQFFYADQPNFTVSRSQIHHNTTGINVLTGTGIFINRDDLLILDNKIFQNERNGIEISSTTSSGQDSRNNPTIAGNRIYKNARSGINISANYSPRIGLEATDADASPLISKNYIHGNRDGISAHSNDPDGSNGHAYAGGEIQNNIIASNEMSGITLTHSGEGQSTAKIFNNTLVDNFAYGILHDVDDLFTFRIRNNSVTHNGFGISGSSAYAPNPEVVGYNNVYGNNVSNWRNYPASFGDLSQTNSAGAPVDAEFNMSADPFFVAETMYQVESSSPMNDAGTASESPADDFVGRARMIPYDIGAYETSPAPKIEDVTINSGDSQRSFVDRITVQFDQVVELDNDGDSPIEIIHVESGQPVEVETTLSVADGKTSVTVTFLPGPSVGVVGTLLDGNYQLTLKAAMITSGVAPLDGNGDGVGGDDYVFGSASTDNFFRLFGDSDGDRDVDGQDYGRFGLSFLKDSNDEDYNPVFDSDRDGDVDGQDYGRFGANFLKSI